MPQTQTKPEELTNGLKWKFHFIALHIFIPIFVGGAIYICWRKSTLLMFGWYTNFGLRSEITHIRELTAAARHVLPNWILYSLPDALWVYSLTAFMSAVWFKQRFSMVGVVWISVGLVLSVTGELCQAIGIVSGTFDPVDLLLCVASAVAAFIVATRSVSKRTPGERTT